MVPSQIMGVWEQDESVWLATSSSTDSKLLSKSSANSCCPACCSCCSCECSSVCVSKLVLKLPNFMRRCIPLEIFVSVDKHELQGAVFHRAGSAVAPLDEDSKTSIEEDKREDADSYEAKANISKGAQTLVDSSSGSSIISAESGWTASNLVSLFDS
jgi:hypothetical protein